MKRISFSICSFLIISALMYTPLITSAQIGDPCDLTDPFAECPIDGGIVLLLAVGIGIQTNKKINNNIED